MSQGARMNGPASPSGKYIDTIDPDDPEYIRSLQRPAEVKEDMKQMEGRSRVSVVLNSQAFREELEALIQEQIHQGGSASLFALQQISDLLLPQSRGAHSSFGRSSPVIPINDIRGVETLGYTKQEKLLRCKLASCYRLVDLFGWTHGIFNHISARVSQDQEQFLVNPFGMVYSEVTASTLVTVDVRGEVVDSGSTGLGISRAGFCLHSAIHQARPDIRCIIHLHTPAAVAVSATKKGLLPISQEALLCGKVSYHDYQGIFVDQAERDQLARNLGPVNKVMFLRNHGVAVCGETIEEAFHYAFNLMAACEVQVRAMPVGLENLVLVDQETQEKTFRVGSQGGGGADTSGRKWRCGELEFEALMRILDNTGYRTGHAYKQPLMKQEKRERTNSDVEVPPASSSFTYVFDGDYERSKYVSPIKLAMERQKQAYKAGWLTSPNTYKKEEIEEIGTTTPKKITKWVQDGEAEQRSTAIKVENPNQFAPQGRNPKEFKEKQKSMRKDYYEDKVTAGPQSKILDGVSAWDEAAKTKDGEQTVVVGAASKGIIQRDHQHNAVVYRSYYAANPFENMTEEDIAVYKQGLEQGEGGDFVFTEESPGPEGQLVSSEERHQNIQRSQEDMHEDTEANRAQAMPMDSVVRDDGKVLEQERSVQPPPSPPKEPVVCAGLPLALSLVELGLDGLVDTLVQLVMAAAQSSSLRREEKHSVRKEDRLSQGSIQDSLSADSSMSLTAPNQSAVKSDSAVSPGEGVKTSGQKVDVPVSKTELSQVPQIMTMQLEPTKLFQGKPGDGVMRISFSIQSKVTRRKNRGPKSLWPVENVTIMQSRPKVMMVQPVESHPPQILQEQQNVIEPPVKEPVTFSVPVCPTYQQKPFKRHFHSSGRHQKLSKLAKPKKKFSHWSRRGLTHPLSPVTEEFMEGDDTLEALLAQQNVHVDSDDSLEELLLMAEEYKENFVPKPQSNKPQASSSSAEDRTAPIATVEDLDENGDVSPAPTQGEKPEEGPVFVVPKASVNHSVSPYRGQGTYTPVKPSSPGPPEEQVFSGDQTGKLVREAFETDKKSTNIDDELKFADEEMSSTFPEASDGDIAPRKQEDGLGSAGLMHLSPDSMEGVPVEEEMAQKTSGVLSASVSSTSEAFVEEENIQVENEDQHDLVSPCVSQPEPGSDGTEKSNGMTFKTDGVETSPPLVDRGPDTDSAPKPSADPGTRAPLAGHEEDWDAPAPAVSSSSEEKTKTALYRSDSAALENSPIVSRPPFDDFPREPVYRELHRVRSLEGELDEPSSVQRRLSQGHGAVRRVQSVGPALDSMGSKNRNVAVIDAVLHTVTIDPAKVAQSGQSVATYLREASEQTTSSNDQKKRWTLMDSVSKSLEALDVEDLAKEGSVIYGRSLEIVIQGGNMPQKSTPSSSSPHETKTPSSENLVEDSKEKVAPKSTKLYKDDVVVITKTPIEFSAISPQMRKDIGEEEGPLVTSSPKLGRRKEGSFKKYQSKMGKSEETLLEVAPLTPEKAHPAARRTRSFPKNDALIKNRSRDTVLDHLSSQTLDRERELRTSSQSVDEVTERNKRRKKIQRARNSDPAYSYSAVDSPLDSENLYMKNSERRKSEEVYSSAAKSTYSIDHSEISREERDHSHRRRRRQPSPEGGREQARRRGQMEEGVAEREDETERTQSSGRDGRREDSTEDRKAGIVDEPERAKSRDRRRRRRGQMEEGVKNREDETERMQSSGRDRRRRREESTEDREAGNGIVDEPERAKNRDRDKRRREESTGNREAGIVDEPERAKSRDRDKRRREESTGDREARNGIVDEPERTQSRDRDRRRSRREESTRGREAVNGMIDEPERTQSRDRDRRSSRREESPGGRDAGMIDEPERMQSRDRDRGRREESREAGLEDEPERMQSPGRDRRRRGQMEEGIDDREDKSEKMQSSGRDRRRKRREESTEGREDELKRAQSPAREGRRREKEGTEDRDAGVEGDPERTQKSVRDRRRRDKGTDDRENEAERMESSGRDRRRRGQIEDDREAGQVYEPERMESSGRDRRRREESTEDRETEVGNDPKRMPSSDRDRRKRRDDMEEGTDDREVDEPERTQTLDRDRRRRGDMNEGTEDRENKPERTQTLGRDRRRGDIEEGTEDREVDEPERTQTSDRDRRRRRQSDMEEMSDLQTAEAAGKGQEKVEGEEQVYDNTEQSTYTRKEAGAVEEAVPPAPSPDTELQDTEDFPPPPDDLYDYEKQMDTDVDDTAQVTSQQEEDTHLPAFPVKDSSYSEMLEDEENQPPRMRRPRTKAKETERISTDNGTLKTNRDIADKTELRKSQKPGTDPSQEESTFMSSFKQPERNSQTLGEDFPSLAVRSHFTQSAPTDKENSVTEKRKPEKDSKMNVLREPIESEGTVPIAGNLDLLDYSDETSLRMDPPRHSPTEDDKPKISRARQRAECRRRMKSDEDKEVLGLDVSSSEGPKDSTDNHAAGDSHISGAARGSSSRENLTRQDSLESRQLREQQKGRRSSKDSEKSRNMRDRRSSRDSTASRDIKNIRASRDSLASRGKSNRTEYIASKENLSRRESQESDVAGVDIMSLDQEPARGRQDRVQRDSASRNMDREDRESSASRNMDREDRESENSEKPRSGGRVRGRRSGHGEGLPHTDRPTRNDGISEDNTQSAVPWIRVQTASRETLDKEDFSLPLPPKQHRSMEHLSELGQEPHRSRSKEILDAPDSPDIPPELPPKKNKKTLSCVGGHDKENYASPKKERKSKDRSSSKERKKMPPPPARPFDQRYSEEPRRRRHHQDSNYLKVPGDSFHREDSFDASVEKDRRLRERESSSPYYGDSEDVFDGAEAPHRRDEKRPVQEDGTVSPPQTPRPARKMSTSSYGSVSARIARSVSFDDGYTPTMSHPPHHNKSRESLGSEASYHTTSYRPRSYSGASETSLVSNPLNYDPWRAKATAQHSKSPNSRRRSSGSQGEPTYSANAGRRRRSRTPSTGDTNRLYQPRKSRSRSSLPDAPSRSAAPSGHNRSRDTSMLADDSFSDAYSHGYASEAMHPVPAPRRSDPERQQRKSHHREVDEGRPVDSASGGETLEERSSKEGSPTKEAPSPTKDKKKKKKFRMPSFAKNKKKESKESTL